MAEDYYKVLGVGRDASQADIQKAYRELARKYHPDLNPHDKAAKKKFQNVQTAFDVLKDPSKRELYDRYGSSFENVAAGGPRPGQGWSNVGGGSFEDVDFSQFFGERFGGDPAGGFADIFSQINRAGRRGGARAQRRGAHLESEVTVPFATAVQGGQMPLSVRRGDGKTETLSVKIPSGIEDGKKVRLRGQGEAGIGGGPPGDLLITVRIEPHPHFQRRGDALLVKVPVTLREAAEGAKIDVPTPSGVVSLRVPRCTSSGTKLRIKGHGVRAAGRPPGDLLADIQIVLPEQFSDDDLEKVRQIDERHPQNPRADLRW